VTQSVPRFSRSWRLAAAVLLLAAGCNTAFNSCLTLPQGRSPGPNKVGVGFTLDVEEANGLAEASLTYLEQIGVTWARVPISWAQIQPSREKQDWRNVDYLVQAAQRHNVRLQLVIKDTAPWASSAPFVATTARASYPPASYEEWFRFVLTAATRYKDYVKDWEIWDNIDRRKGWSGRPEQYAKLVTYASKAIRAMNPQAKVILGSITYAQDRENQFVDTLLQDRANPITASVDALALRPGVGTPGQLRERFFALKRTMSMRDVSKPILITGIAWSSDTVRQTACEGYQGGETGQAQYLRETMPWLLDIGAERVFWDQLWDGSTDTAEGTLGLIDRTLQPKAALGALAGLVDPNRIGRPVTIGSDTTASPSDVAASPAEVAASPSDAAAKP
jgi:hypothetical protein